MLRRIAGLALRRSLRVAVGLAIGSAYWAPAIATAEQPEVVEFPSADRQRTPLAGYLYKPAGRGPFPAVIALHGCGGLFAPRAPGHLSSRHDDWADRLVRQGYVVFFPDSFGPRGVESVCKIRPRPVTLDHRVRDIQGAIAWLSRRSFVDPERMALLGWSHGATTVMTFAGRRRSRDADVRLAVAFYPGCRRFLDDPSWRPRIPLTILIGSADDWTPAEPCRRLAQRFPKRIELVEYANAVHGFDAPAQQVHLLRGLAFTPSGSGEAHAGTEPEARRQAIRDVKMQLDEAFERD
ncbi:dienelactone hydrolase family protein [Nannocystis punicea]|uniref:Dienelactone hydrolase family protein n=1 Tax=Nannocystis punicea TaxID=2995304 RepID=A0ABY7GVJ8_9BACT|nr:dienelactone hydrolase family protein [Nannocystis poenicansa]WAS90962.1 dienelactone hydrolase family protein [Nannocystis poenicansa]